MHELPYLPFFMLPFIHSNNNRTTPNVDPTSHHLHSVLSTVRRHPRSDVTHRAVARRLPHGEVLCDCVVLTHSAVTEHSGGRPARRLWEAWNGTRWLQSHRLLPKRPRKGIKQEAPRGHAVPLSFRLSSLISEIIMMIHFLTGELAIETK